MTGSKTRNRTLRAVSAVTVAVVSLGLAACSVQPRVVSGSEITIAVDTPFTSANAATSYGGTSVNSNVDYLTGSGFGYVDDEFTTVADDYFGKAEIVTRDPFTVRYSVADDSEWSDGVAVDGADLLLAWAAESRAVNTYPAGSDEFDPAAFIDPDTGRFTDEFPADVVYFDGAPASGVDASSTAEVDGGGRSITVEFAEYVPDWQLAIQPGVPAHVLAELALDASADDPARAKSSVIQAIDAGEGDDLAALSRTWNDGWNFAEMPENPALLVASGPYRVGEIVAGESVTLVPNERYSGARQPIAERLVFRYAATPADAVAMVADGTADVAMPQATTEIVQSVVGLENVTASAGAQSRLEQLQFNISSSRSGAFADAEARRAFLMSIPRADVVTQLIGAVNEDAQVLDSFVFQPGTAAYDASARINGSDRYAEPDLPGARAELARSTVASPEVCILFDPADARLAAAFALIQTAAGQVGFTVTSCESADWRALLGTPDTYDAVLLAVDTTADGTVDVDSHYLSDSPLNSSGYASDETDALIRQYLAESDSAERASLLQQIDVELWTDAVGVPLFTPPSLLVTGPRVEGVTNAPLPQGALWNAWDWTLAPEPEPSADPSGEPTDAPEE
ncbi:MAG: ABC transporter substrate-binding protein [Microbacteriaceae bacterium]